MFYESHKDRISAFPTVGEFDDLRTAVDASRNDPNAIFNIRIEEEGNNSFVQKAVIYFQA